MNEVKQALQNLQAEVINQAQLDNELFERVAIELNWIDLAVDGIVSFSHANKMINLIR